MIYLKQHRKTVHVNRFFNLNYFQKNHRFEAKDEEPPEHGLNGYFLKVLNLIFFTLLFDIWLLAYLDTYIFIFKLQKQSQDDMTRCCHFKPKLSRICPHTLLPFKFNSQIMLAQNFHFVAKILYFVMILFTFKIKCIFLAKYEKACPVMPLLLSSYETYLLEHKHIDCLSSGYICRVATLCSIYNLGLLDIVSKLWSKNVSH